MATCRRFGSAFFLKSRQSDLWFFSNATVWIEISQAGYIMDGSSILHLRALEKLFMLHFLLFGWRPHRGQQYIAPKHMGISLVISFLFPFFSYPHWWPPYSYSGRTNPFGVLTIFSESLIGHFQAVTTHSEALTTPSEALTTPSEALPVPVGGSHIWSSPTPSKGCSTPSDALPHPQRSSAHILNKAPCPILYRG